MPISSTTYKHLIALVALAACTGDAPSKRAAAEGGPRRSGQQRALDGLHAFERQKRAATDFASLPPGNRATGPDPYRVVAIPGPGDRGYLGLLRGDDALVVLSPELEELQRLDAPASPTGLAVLPGGAVLVSGEGVGKLRQYRVTADGRVEPVRALEFARFRVPRALAAHPNGLVYVVDELTGKLSAVQLGPVGRGDGLEARARADIERCHGPVDVQVAGDALVVNCLLDHALVIRALDGDGIPQPEEVRIEHDGPLWSLAAAWAGGALIVAAGGVENRPLVREDGAFGYIDSFVYLYRIDSRTPELIAAINVAEHGVVTPKWLDLAVTGDAAELLVTGYGGERMAAVTVPLDGSAPGVVAAPAPPGITSMARAGDGWVAADPLLDAWVRLAPGAPPALVPVPSARPRTAEARVGEALFFTTLMAPQATSAGERSRFTCETCHFEGYVDGRVHFTGRDDVHATTKPLRGLFNNAPHFTRALDRTTTRMVHAEFRVANAKTPQDPWFAIARDDHAWLAAIDGVPASLSPTYLRRALLVFLLELTHTPSPMVRNRDAFDDRQRAGAEAFRDLCADCHAPRLVTDDPASAVPFERWEPLIFSDAGPIVWASAEYRKTGVVPYVHADGARTTSLRRLYKKYPYFTNGSAKSVEDVLERAGWTAEGVFQHDGLPEPARRLDRDQRRALHAFLELL